MWVLIFNLSQYYLINVNDAYGSWIKKEEQQQ